MRAASRPSGRSPCILPAPMRFLLLALTALLLPQAALAQDFAIEAVEVREPTPDAVELVVTIRNQRRTASNYSVLAHLPGAATLPLVSSTERLGPGATADVVLRFDASGYTRPFSGSVVVRNHRRSETDRRAFTLEPPPEPPAPLELRMEVQMEIPPIVEATVSALTFRIATGADDRRQGTVVFAKAYDVDGALLTTANGIVPGSAVLATLDAPSWASGSVREVEAALLHPVAPSQIDRVELSASPGYRLGGTDQWDVTRVEVLAGGRALGSVQGVPFHRFTTQSRDRTLQLRPPDLGRPVNLVEVVLHTGGDDKRAQSHVRVQALDRNGEPLNATPFENHWVTTQALPPWSSRSIGGYLDRSVRAQEIGSIVIEHESVQTGPFDNADDWTLSGVDVLLYQGSSTSPERDRVQVVATGAPLYRFEGANRRFVLRLP